MKNNTLLGEKVNNSVADSAPVLPKIKRIKWVVISATFAVLLSLGAIFWYRMAFTSTEAIGKVTSSVIVNRGSPADREIHLAIIDPAVDIGKEIVITEASDRSIGNLVPISYIKDKGLMYAGSKFFSKINIGYNRPITYSTKKTGDSGLIGFWGDRSTFKAFFFMYLLAMLYCLNAMAYFLFGVNIFSGLTKLSPRGITVVGCVIALLIIVFVAVIVKKANDRVTSKTAQIGSAAPAKSTVVDYLNIAELGIKISLTSDLRDLYYKQGSDGSINLSTKLLTLEEPLCDASDLGHSLGQIKYFTNPDSAEASEGGTLKNMVANPNAVNIGGKYFYFRTTQQFCVNYGTHNHAGDIAYITEDFATQYLRLGFADGSLKISAL